MLNPDPADVCGSKLGVLRAGRSGKRYEVYNSSVQYEAFTFYAQAFEFRDWGPGEGQQKSTLHCHEEPVKAWRVGCPAAAAMASRKNNDPKQIIAAARSSALKSADNLHYLA